MIKSAQKRNHTKRSVPFRMTRGHHHQEAAEDYTELISDLIEKKGEARIGDIAEHLGISHVTALRTIKRLQQQGYFRTTPHKPVVLTPKGKKTADYCKKRHKILLEFFLKLGVPKNIAEIDVEGVEHHISRPTLRAIQTQLKKLESSG